MPIGIHYPYISTSESGTTSSSGQNACPQGVHYSEFHHAPTSVGKLKVLHHDILVQSEEEEGPKQESQQDSDNGCHKPHDAIVQEDKV